MEKCVRYTVFPNPWTVVSENKFLHSDLANGIWYTRDGYKLHYITTPTVILEGLVLNPLVNTNTGRNLTF